MVVLRNILILLTSSTFLVGCIGNDSIETPVSSSAKEPGQDTLKEGSLPKVGQSVCRAFSGRNKIPTTRAKQLEEKLSTFIHRNLVHDCPPDSGSYSSAEPVKEQLATDFEVPENQVDTILLELLDRPTDLDVFEYAELISLLRNHPSEETLARMSRLLENLDCLVTQFGPNQRGMHREVLGTTLLYAVRDASKYSNEGRIEARKVVNQFLQIQNTTNYRDGIGNGAPNILVAQGALVLVDI